ncbi:hypothetical protein SAY86_029314 [Trapa natans]|uniref:WAT1-related protein n=1 Tax=Trapa natans TaxID=22666 RepID=A0AAN7ML33_TRANT|nr:hypothetical protein SAY86_029314 [Trapa natans]
MHELDDDIIDPIAVLVLELSIDKAMGAAAPYIAMMLVQLSYGGANIFTKIALDRGLNQFVFMAYRHIIAGLLLGPFAYVLERKQRPLLSLKVATKIFVISSLGTTIHLNIYYAGMEYTSATVAAALGNVMPCLTFLMAVLLRMETVRLKSWRGRAKVIGTLICVGGSLTFTFWKGRCFTFVKRPLIHRYASTEPRHVEEDWIKGTALILLSHVTWSLWLIFQAIVYKDYPARLSFNTLICISASIQSSLLGLLFARDPSQWRLGWDVKLWNILYTGVIVSAMVNNLLIWAVNRKGPVFAAMFCPLMLVVVGIFSAIFFAEKFHLGSMIGTCLIILGLYCVLWGKAKENSRAEVSENEKGESDNKQVEVSIHDNNKADTEK